MRRVSPGRALAVLLLACSASLATAAAEPLFLDQSLELRYDLWKESQSGSSSTGDARYDFMVTAPIATYRLGSLAVMGTLEYGRAADQKRTSTYAGLTSYGLHATLFPYRNFHLFLDYRHTQSPTFFGATQMRGDSYGLEYLVRNRTLPNLDFSVRRNVLTGGAQGSAWTQWSLSGDKTTANTRYTFALLRQDFTYTGSPGWAMDSLTAASDTRLPNAWHLMAGLSLLDTPGAWDANTYWDLSGMIGPWTSTSNLDLVAETTDSAKMQGLALSQTFSRSWTRYTFYGSAGVTSLRGDSEAESSPSGTAISLQAGGMFAMGSGWSLLGDVGLARALQQSGATVSGDLTTFHVGVARGGDLPSLLRHSLFFISDASFQHRTQADYPPGYVPSELATQMMQHRAQQMGTLQFAADYYHTQRGGGGTLDWARATGSLQAGAHFNMMIMGDSIRDDGFTLRGRSRREDDLSANLVFSFGASAITLSGGYFKTREQGAALGSATPQSGQPTLYYTLGFSSRLGIMAYGLLVTRWDHGDGHPLTSYSLNDSLTFRNISFRLVLSNYPEPNGRRVSTLSVDLLRLFSTASFLGPRRRA